MAQSDAIGNDADVRGWRVFRITKTKKAGTQVGHEFTILSAANQYADLLRKYDVTPGNTYEVRTLYVRAKRS